MNYARKQATRSSLSPGDIVPRSGIYVLTHGNCASQEMEKILLAGQTFPPCRWCGSQVRFQLQHGVPHISEDRDFGR
jgi:hypothetical protein